MVGLIYLLKVVLVTVLTAMLLAFALEPLVHQLQRIRIPRPVGALLAVLLLIAVAARFDPLLLQPRRRLCHGVAEVFEQDSRHDLRSSGTDQQDRRKHQVGHRFAQAE